MITTNTVARLRLAFRGVPPRRLDALMRQLHASPYRIYPRRAAQFVSRRLRKLPDPLV